MSFFFSNMRGCLFFVIDVVYLAIKIVSVRKSKKVAYRRMRMSSNSIYGFVP